MTGASDPVVLVAHGSRDPRAAAVTEALTRAVAAARPGLLVRASYLDHGPPRPGAVLAGLEAAGHRAVVLVPLLLTAAYHGRVDIPGALAAARDAGLRIPVRVTDVLGPTVAGPHPELLAGLRRRLSEVTGDRSAGRDGAVDGVVLAAAGTRDAAARRTVERAAEALGATLDVPTRVGYASASPPTAGEAVTALRAAGARRVAVATYFLAPGRLHGSAMESARRAGAVGLAAPLGDAPELARLVLARLDESRHTA
ncbi:CbiX/SirB N-terminal domain-containing protein [Plantactinospora sp. B24E8]|uniref:sirohydrochlorin chelatase n=1 Tax=Plantactinospora sp. B24E8 TaxID=3153567 RepID=UPI00325D1F01